MRTAAVLTAAGGGARLGHRLPKALVPLDGTPLVTHAARRLVASGGVDVLVVTVPDGHEDAFARALGPALTPPATPATPDPGGQSGADAASPPPVRVPVPVPVPVPVSVPAPVPVLVVAGGPSRQASVAAALAALPADVDVVLVHDAARALVPPSLVRRVAAAVRSGHRAVVPALAVTDTILRVGAAVPPPAGTGGAGAAAVVAVAGTLDRSTLRAVQTPQGFDRALLDRAHLAAADRALDERHAATDDSSLVAALGEPVVAVDGDERALKITTPRDLALAHLVLAQGAGDDA